MDDQNTHTVIAGAGISGIRAALDFAEIGHKVILLDKSGSTGGILSQLDRQFPDNHCGMCTMLPMIDRDKGPQFCLRRGLFHENVILMLSTEIVSVEGPEKNLTVTLETKHTGVNPDLCIGCGACEETCPVSVPDEFNTGLTTRKAIFLPVPHQVPYRRIIDFDACTRCGECVSTCPGEAIAIEGEPLHTELKNVHAVILATGASRYDPTGNDLYGYGVLPNVVTADGFERIMNSKGPSTGELIRPSDGKTIQKAAWIQCVGSRNIMENADHCSSACCMFALKEAILACEKGGENFEATFFYMDFRTYGRDFQRYLDAAREKHHFNFIRCRVHSIETAANSDDLEISYITSDGGIEKLTADLAVLSTGKDPSARLPDYAGNPGVFPASESLEFKDVAESIVGAHTAACRSLTLSGLPEPLPRAQPDMTLGFAAVRPMVVWCTCSGKDDNTAEPEHLRGKLNALPGTIAFFNAKFARSNDDIKQIVSAILEAKANRVVLAACTPHLFARRIKQIARATNLPEAFFKVATIPASPATVLQQIGTQRALSTIKSAISRLNSTSLDFHAGRPVTKSALVVGGGPAGLSAALAIAGTGIHVDIVESSDRLGGNSIRFPDSPEKNRVDAMVTAVADHPDITIHLESRITRHQGISGDFTAEIRTGSSKETTRIRHGAAVIATGGTSLRTDAYHIADHPDILTLFDLEEMIRKKEKDFSALSQMVFIQCAGTRQEPRNYCSRICCTKALRTAIALRASNPDLKITVFYRDIMTYGESEKIYTQARRSGVLFIPYDASEKPAVEIKDGKMAVRSWNPITQETVTLHPDLLALSTGIMPAPDAAETADLFRLPLTQDDFFQEVNSKWRPTDSGREGIFVCGLGRAPLNAFEAMDEGMAAGMRALRILGRAALPISSVTAKVRHSLCSQCLACIPECPYQARYVDPEGGQVMVDAAACQGCGACAAVCPNSTNIMGRFEETGIMDTIEHFLNEEFSI